MSEPSCRLHFKVIPGAPRDAVVGELGDAIRVKLRAPPVEGKANAALLVFLAARLGLRVSQLRLVTGETSRHKLIAITGLAADAARRQLLQGS
jgi:uncharacterized protein